MSTADAAKPARKRKRKSQPRKRGVTIPLPDTDSDEDADRILAEEIPEWEKLDKDERAEFLRLVRELRKRGEPAKVTGP